MDLRSKWNELVEEFNNKTVADRHYEALVKAYAGRKRFYHNLTHIEDLYRLFEEYRPEIQSPRVFQFAIWYHDVVYKILHAQVNEKLSARKAGLQLKELSWEEDKFRQVEALIRDTRFHRIQASEGLPDAPWLLDMDLAILGAEPERYDEYRDQIRREYWIVPTPVFRAGRVKTLRRLLSRERIYHTDAFYKNREEQARKNIKRELAKLKPVGSAGY